MPQFLVAERREAAQILLGRLDRHVLRRVGKVEEERPVFVLLDELHRLPIQHVGQIALESRHLPVPIDRRIGDVDHLAGRLLAAKLF